MTKAVVLLSGGMDSAVTAWIARRHSTDLYVLSIMYGSSHMEQETSRASKLARKLGVHEHKILYVPLNEIGGSALTGQGELPKGETVGIASTWVPQRNAIFLTLASAYAEVVGALEVYIGVNQVDYSGYPDCRGEFLSAMEKTINLASKRFVLEKQRTYLRAPILHMSKTEIIKEGLAMDVPFEDTYTCYRGLEKSCGTCPSCCLRRKAFWQLDTNDPLPYDTNPCVTCLIGTGNDACPHTISVQQACLSKRK